MDGMTALPRRRARRTETAPQTSLHRAFEAVNPRPAPAVALAPAARAQAPTWVAPARRAIEDDAFAFEVVSDIAEAESWRKEVHRPIHYLHKWWARRLGTVFRAAVIGALAPSGSDVMRLLYQPTRFPGAVVMDPFMGSGVTLGEALKLGARAIGRDINPVAHFLVRNALAKHDRAAVLDAFHALKRDVAPRLRHHARARLPDGQACEVLYWFWVKQVPCPSCGNGVDLFSSRVFAQHAYPRANPRAQATCPCCGEVNEVRHDARAATCRSCATAFDPQQGPARGQKAFCPSCSHGFAIIDAVRKLGRPPGHRLYAKLVLDAGGGKRYLRADAYDHAVYAEAEAELAERRDAYPEAEITPGYNTDQALGYGYRRWHEFFNARQLLCLSILAEAIRGIADEATRELMACLFSGTLEFNNLFSSYKGEGTGAVRPMFAHHILKPERTPLEANVWGTPESSGSFSGLFESRVLRALGHAEAPTELRIAPKASAAEGKRPKAEKVAGLSDPIGFEAAATYAEFEARAARLYLSCGDSARTDLPDACVDAVVTDPPFFDNVHYSQLADFFHVWQRHALGEEGPREQATTRSPDEVQDEDAGAFAAKLGGVLRECRRVLRPDGLLAFTYHHSRPEGWISVLSALVGAGFRVVAAHPVKAEMSVAVPKSQAKEPIDLDVLLVCRQRQGTSDVPALPAEAIAAVARKQVSRFVARGRRLSRNDVRVVVMAQALRAFSAGDDPNGCARQLSEWTAGEALIAEMCAEQGTPATDGDG